MPKYPYRDLGTGFDRNFRNALNANFDDIEADIKELGAGAQQALEAADEANTQAIYAQTSGDYANDKGDYAAQQGDYAKAQGDYAKAQANYAKQVGDENKTRWLTAVNTYADIAATYPNPQLGDTVQTIDDSKIYRWDGAQWVWTQQYNANAITDVQNKIGILNKKTDGIVSVKEFGAKGDGITDDTAAIQTALDTAHTVYMPPGTYLVSDTIRVGPRGRGLIGASENIRAYGSKTTVIKYIGELNRKRTVILLGSNDVGSEPTVDASEVIIKNLHIDANNLAGFCVYGTYLTNESLVDRVVLYNSLEYNMYVAKGWYATFQNIVSTRCKGNGIALGMPLEYMDGTAVNWTTASPLELNHCTTTNIRSAYAGAHFWEDNPGTYDPTDPTIRRKGYGIGAGIGNSFILRDFLSEASGGVGLYVYTGSQPVKHVTDGYLEGNARGSGLDPASTMPQIIIENTSSYGDAIIIENIFCNRSSGGIYHTGNTGRKVWLKNIFQPRFLKSLDGLNIYDLYQHVLKDHVHYECGYCNTSELHATPVVHATVNTRYAWEIPVPYYSGYYIIKVKGDGTVPWGSFYVVQEDGTLVNYSFPSGLSATEYTTVAVISGVKKLMKGGGTGDTHNSNVTFKVLATPITYQ